MSGEYPLNWPDIAARIKDRAAWRCIRCLTHHNPRGGYCLTVHHLDGDKSHCADWNLAALCQRCHLHVQATVNMAQAFLFPTLHSAWLRPFLYRRRAAGVMP